MARMEIFEWGPLLKRWSEEWLEGLATEDPEEFQELDEEIVRGRWLGFGPADPAAVAALEERVRGLGIAAPLPPSLRSFLETTDGWRHAEGFVYLLAGADRIAPYGDPYGQQVMYEEHLDQDPTEEEVLRAGMWGRALQLSLDSDMTDVLLDPGDVGADGEWAVYVYHGWGGEPPDRYDSFRAFMEDMYKEFYRLGGGHSGFENVVTRELDAKVEQARLACLRGELDGALAVLGEAEKLGRPRAVLLASQLRALLDGRGWVPVDPRMDDPLYAGEVLPLKVRDHLREYRRTTPSCSARRPRTTRRTASGPVPSWSRSGNARTSTRRPVRSGERSRRPGNWRAGATRTAPGGYSRRRSRTGSRTGRTTWHRSVCSGIRSSGCSSHRSGGGSC